MRSVSPQRFRSGLLVYIWATNQASPWVGDGGTCPQGQPQTMEEQRVTDPRDQEPPKEAQKGVGKQGEQAKKRLRRSTAYQRPLAGVICDGRSAGLGPRQ